MVIGKINNIEYKLFFIVKYMTPPLPRMMTPSYIVVKLLV